MGVSERDAALRAALFSRLGELTARTEDGTVRSAEVNRLEFEGRPFHVIGQTGIRKVAGLDAALSFTTVYRREGAARPYEDDVGPDGLLRYKYRGTDPNHHDNVALRRATELRTPLAYFVGVAPGVYRPIWPVYLVSEDRDRHEFSVAVDPAQLTIDPGRVDADTRRWVERLTRQRVHQPQFRVRVLRAYADTCAMCRLRHPELLDAAHILEDTHERGQPVVPNGLALCKIHHAAFDKNIVGVRPDLFVEVREDILREIDGPMLRHGLQEMNGVRLIVPRSRYDQPDTARLAERYDAFRRAG